MDLKVLFVTNGTSKILYYTKEHNGAVLGMEDAPISPFTQGLSASGDGIVAGRSTETLIFCLFGIWLHFFKQFKHTGLIYNETEFLPFLFLCLVCLVTLDG